MKAKEKLADYPGEQNIEDYLQNHFTEIRNDKWFFEYLGENLYQELFGFV
jgi:hypothetical protein